MKSGHHQKGWMENSGIEPETSCMLSTRSTNWANPPYRQSCSTGHYKLNKMKHHVIKWIALKQRKHFYFNTIGIFISRFKIKFKLVQALNGGFKIISYTDMHIAYSFWFHKRSINQLEDGRFWWRTGIWRLMRGWWMAFSFLIGVLSCDVHRRCWCGNSTIMLICCDWRAHLFYKQFRRSRIQIPLLIVSWNHYFI